jgi:hypothetical protein
MIVGGLLLALAQLWLIPASFNLKSLEYMVSSRDNPPLQSELRKSG